MKFISSDENRIYKSALKLLQKKYRDRTGKYIIEGIKSIEDALSTGTSVDCIFICEGFSHVEREYGVPASVLERKLFRALSDTENTQGMIAVADKGSWDRESFAETALKKGVNLVILDRLQDPGNTGTIIRTAEAAGYGGVILMKGTADVYSPKGARSAAGSLFRMPVLQGEEEKDVIEMLKSFRKKITVSCLEAGTCFWEADMSGDIALVIGNEGSGVSRGFLEASDMKVMIPMKGSIESLNAAVAAGILMYQSQKTNNMRGKSYANSTE